MTTTRARGRASSVLLAAAVTTAGMLGGCGGSSSPKAAASASAWLSSIPDTSTYRTSITVNDLHTLWTSTGLSFPPSVTQINTGAGLAASRQIAFGSPIGSGLLNTINASPHLLGYDPLALNAEVVVGQPPAQLSLVQGQINVSQVKTAMGQLGLHPTAAARISRYSITDPLRLPGEVAPQELVGVRNLAVFAGGGRAAAGGPSAPFGDVSNLLLRRRQSASLASDPDVKRAMVALDGAQVMTFGTSLVASFSRILGPNATPAASGQLARRLGLDELPAGPSFAGYGYVPLRAPKTALPGGPTTLPAAARTHPTLVAVAIYPNGSDAKAAATIIGNVLRTATSVTTEEPYSSLFSLGSITVEGNAVVARLTERRAGIVAQAVEQNDFPLFWSPPKS